MDFIAALDVIRCIYIAAAALMVCLLAWRITKWSAKFHEPAWLHMSAMFYAVGAMYVGISNLDKPMSLMFPLNFFGTLCLVIFVWKVPEEKPKTWREQRGDPPDWDSKFRDL